MVTFVKQFLLHQFDAALCMLNDCIVPCPAAVWDTPVVKYPFWQVAYHTLCFVDLYLSPGERAFEPSPRFLPTGMKELDDEYPSRRFTKDEITEYLGFCRKKLHAAMEQETEASLAAPCGFERRNFSRAEMYIYNLRHVQHHAAQLGAVLRKADPGIDPRWVGGGWKA